MIILLLALRVRPTALENMFSPVEVLMGRRQLFTPIPTVNAKLKTEVLDEKPLLRNGTRKYVEAKV